MSTAHLISDGISLICIYLCLFLKVPQIRSIYALKSAKGINIYGLLMELVSYTTTALYNIVNGYALLTYMEYPVIIVQEYILIYLVLYYQQLLGSKTLCLVSLYIAVVFSFLIRLLDGNILTYLVPFGTPLSLSSKAIQLLEILRSRNADTVSMTTWILSAVTNAGRIYTIYLDSADIILLTNVILSTILSSSIVVATYTFQKMRSKVE